MCAIQELVEHLVPVLFPIGPGPYWVSVTGDLGRCHPERWEGEQPEEDEVAFEFLSGPFPEWRAGPDCEALIVVAPCTTNATGHLFQRDQSRESAGRGITEWQRGTLYFGVSRRGEQFAIEVGDDGPRTAGVPSRGLFVDMVRAKLGLLPLDELPEPSPPWRLDLA